jgi:DNA processing protein
VQRRPLDNAERRDWLRLTRADNVGPITFRHLLQRYGSAAAALEALPDLAARGGKRSFKLPAAKNIEDELAGRIERQAGHKVALVASALINNDKSEVA